LNEAYIAEAVAGERLISFHDDAIGGRGQKTGHGGTYRIPSLWKNAL
jgi:hypothetical protein